MPTLSILEIHSRSIDYTPEEFERKKREIGIVREAVKEGVTIFKT
jgi:hypothetical protein